MSTIVGRSNVGAREGPNQDAMGWDEPRQLALVADGMGGYASGEIASGLVKRAILDSEEPLDLEVAILKAHASILASAADNPEFAGMGSTVVALQIAQRRCRVAWVGDSRGYLWRRGSLQPLTRDHSVAEALRDVESLSETQIRSHPLRNRVTQSLGVDQPVPSTGVMPLRHGDWILLCSDGLHGELRDHEISALLSAHAALDGAADALVEAALGHGGHDNVTVVLVEYTGRSLITWSGMRSERAVVWLAVLGGVLSAIAVTAIAWWLKSWR
jgi:serine/threonine protein phosphatase PrpC